ncbi:ATP-binding protein [Blastococcus sp. TF02A-30]|uniref:ATP-binding protein n=1 Tax=Blastococcus sp. TF02A-30 TaxID=2250580 RepID=UPI001314FAF2|nr:ATP-binding protein [Blastococcus sp. TF02A-30]
MTLPLLTVLTGANGSGKSNLLEALNDNAVIFDEYGHLQTGVQVRLFRLGELIANADAPTSVAQFLEPWAQLYNTVQSWLSNKANFPSRDQFLSWLYSNLDSSRLLTRAALIRMEQQAGKQLDEFSLDDFKNFGPMVSGIKDPFTTSISEVFLSYAHRRHLNDVAQYVLHTKGRGTALSDEEFESRFGAPPWSVLDDVLTLLGLNYRFVPPPEGSDTANYEAALIGPEGVAVRPAELSSGERTILAIAISLFSGTRMSEAIELPRLLLLDEADASLHPSMVQSLIQVIEDVFVRQYGVHVILSTHSPTTVALAPEGAVHIMSRYGSRLRAASSDEAVSALTVGISSLSVRMENRRQVFVESEYDQAVFQEIFSIHKNDLSPEKSLEFIAAGRRDVGGGCDAVNRLVTDLRGTGASTVFGVVDRDNRSAAPPHVHFIDDRHSIENLVFDPLLLGTFLLREQMVSAADLGLPPQVRHFELGPKHAQPLADAISQRLQLPGPTVSCAYRGGFHVDVSQVILEERGHDLENRVVDEFPSLRRYQSNLKRELVRRAMGDVPDYTPQSVLHLLATLVAD